MATYTHLDADDEIAVGLCHLCAFRGGHHADVLAFAHHHGFGKTVDASERDMQISQNTRFRALDHMFAETQPVAGSGAACVDRSGDA
jgi:hypothetical protein